MPRRWLSSRWTAGTIFDKTRTPLPVWLAGAWYLTTQKHGVSALGLQPAHLDAYLDEFVFRFNRRTSTSRGMLFYRLLQQAVITDPVTYDNVVRPLPKKPKPA